MDTTLPWNVGQGFLAAIMAKIHWQQHHVQQQAPPSTRSDVSPSSGRYMSSPSLKAVEWDVTRHEKSQTSYYFASKRLRGYA